MNRNDEQWASPPEEIHLGAEGVHVWRAALRQELSIVEALLSSLDPDERQRAFMFHSKRHREHFIVARGVLREILSRYLRIAPERLRFIYNSHGKPALADALGRLRFNVSHSNEVALYAVTLGREVGLDVEFIREDFPGMEIAEHVFSQQEVAALRALPVSLRTIAFFNCWTRKEAYIKALGEGLSHPLREFTVSLAPGEPAVLLSSEAEPSANTRWWLHELRPGPGYVATLALQRETQPVSLWQWTTLPLLASKVI